MQRLPEYERALWDDPREVLHVHARNMELAGECRAQLHGLVDEIEARLAVE